MRTIRLAAAGLLLLAASTPARAQEPPARDQAEEAFLSFRYDRTAVVLTALYWRDSLYLPAAELLSALHIEADYQAAEGRLSGYYLRPADAYIIDAAVGQGRSAGRTFTIPPLASLPYDDDIYLLPSVFDLLFGWNLDIDMATLTLRLQTEDTLPLQQQRMRELTRSPQPVQGLQPPAPMRYPRQRQLLRGAFGRYSVATSVTSDFASTSYGLALGGEALGGDAQMTFDGTASTEIVRAPRILGRWQYVREEDQVPLSQLRIGTGLLSNGLLPVSFDGVQLTNTPYEPRRQIGEFPLEGWTGAGWEVELYHNDQLIQITTADPDGRYRFVVPLTYGSALLSLRMYSPAGEVVTEHVRLQVPVTFLPPGRTEYHAGAGTAAGTGEQLFQFRLEHGITSWLTAYAGHEVHEDDALERFAAPYAGAVARLPTSGAVAVAETAPGSLLRLRASAVFPSNAQLAVVFTDHARITPLNAIGTDRALRANAFVPFEAGQLPMTLRASAEHNTFLLGGGSSRGYDADLAVTFRAFRPGIGVRRSSLHQAGQTAVLRDELLASATASIRSLPWGLSGASRALAGPTLLGANAVYDRTSETVRQLRIEAARSVSRSGRVYLAWAHQPGVHRNAFEFRYALTTGALHASAGVQAARGRALLSQSMRGTIGYDDGRNVFMAGPQDWVGRAGAALQLFLDHDGNGLRGDNEPLIAAPAIRFREAVSLDMETDGTLVATDLMPYRRYSVSVIAERVPNPLWVPRDTAFSFVTDPNGFKLMQVPFFVAGVIDGMVRAESPDGRGLAGVVVLVRNERGDVVASMSSFSDGSFYHMGLPPGSYTTEIDPDHLQRLGLVSEARAFTIRPTADGDFVSGLLLLARAPPD